MRRINLIPLTSSRMGRFLLNWTHCQQLRRPLCRPGGNCTTNRQPLCRGISPYSTTPNHSRAPLLSAFNSRSCPGCSSNSRIRELRCGEENWIKKSKSPFHHTHFCLFLALPQNRRSWRLWPPLGTNVPCARDETTSALSSVLLQSDILLQVRRHQMHRKMWHCWINPTLI